MTTIAWDGKTLAADRLMCSGDLGMRCEKIRRINSGLVVAWTGTHECGLWLAGWVERGENASEWPAFQATDDWARIIVVRDNAIYTYCRQCMPVPETAERMAWGSGRDFALGALAMGADAVKAVEIASQFDINSGLGVQSWTRM